MNGNDVKSKGGGTVFWSHIVNFVFSVMPVYFFGGWVGKLFRQLKIPASFGTDTNTLIQAAIQEYIAHFGCGAGANGWVKAKFAARIKRLPIINAGYYQKLSGHTFIIPFTMRSDTLSFSAAWERVLLFCKFAGLGLPTPRDSPD